MTRSLGLLLMALVLAGPCAAVVPDDIPHPVPDSIPETPDGTITVSGGVIALGIGFEWAHGVLTFRNHTYPFSVRGLSVMDLGAAKIVGSGTVFNLKSVADFEGDYAGTTFGSAVSRGASLALIKNEKGVIIRVRSAVSGIRFNFSANGLRIRFTGPPQASVGSKPGSVAKPPARSSEARP
jgi:hypothetical protein